jgi:hypothetical protein
VGCVLLSMWHGGGVEEGGEEEEERAREWVSEAGGSKAEGMSMDRHCSLPVYSVRLFTSALSSGRLLR